MGRSAVDTSPADEPRRPIDVASLEDRIAGILAAIAREPTPWRLLELASALQQEIQSRRERSRPN